MECQPETWSCDVRIASRCSEEGIWELKGPCSQGLRCVASLGGCVHDERPILHITKPEQDLRITASSTATVMFEAVAMDAEDGELTMSIRWSTSVGGVSKNQTNGCCLELALQGGPQGQTTTHTITATVTDSAGNSETASKTVAFDL